MYRRARERVGVGVIIAVIAVAGCGSSGSGPPHRAVAAPASQLPECQTVSLQLVSECAVKGVRLVVAHLAEPLKLHTLTARVLGVSTGVSPGSVGIRSPDAGTSLVTVKLQVISLATVAESFDRGSMQTGLEFGGKTYREVSGRPSTATGASLASGRAVPLEPGDAEIWNATYAVPRAVVARRSRLLRSGIYIGNFGDAVALGHPQRNGDGLITLGKLQGGTRR